MKESCRLLSTLSSAVGSAPTGLWNFQAKLHPSPGTLCSLFRQRCHEHHAAKEQLDSTGPGPVQWEGKTGASQDILSCIVGFRSPAPQRQHRFCTLIEKKKNPLSNVIF